MIFQYSDWRNSGDVAQVRDGSTGWGRLAGAEVAATAEATARSDISVVGRDLAAGETEAACPQAAKPKTHRRTEKMHFIEEALSGWSSSSSIKRNHSIYQREALNRIVFFQTNGSWPNSALRASPLAKSITTRTSIGDCSPAPQSRRFRFL